MKNCSLSGFVSVQCRVCCLARRHAWSFTDVCYLVYSPWFWGPYPLLMMRAFEKHVGPPSLGHLLWDLYNVCLNFSSFKKRRWKTGWWVGGWGWGRNPSTDWALEYNPIFPCPFQSVDDLITLLFFRVCSSSSVSNIINFHSRINLPLYLPLKAYEKNHFNSTLSFSVLFFFHISRLWCFSLRSVM